MECSDRVTALLIIITDDALHVSNSFSKKNTYHRSIIHDISETRENILDIYVWLMHIDAYNKTYGRVVNYEDNVEY